MFVKIVENEKYFMSEDFKRWIKNHAYDLFKVKEKVTCNDGSEGYILWKVPFRISKCFTVEIKEYNK